MGRVGGTPRGVTGKLLSHCRPLQRDAKSATKDRKTQPRNKLKGFKTLGKRCKTKTSTSSNPAVGQ